MNNHITILEIDKNALLHNLDFFKKRLKKSTKIMVVAKAFGYGSDAVQIAKILEKHVDYFAVAYAYEGIELRKANIKTPILVLHPQVANLQSCIKYDLEPNLYNFHVLKNCIKIADETSKKIISVHLKFNTGLNRLGFSKSDISSVLSLLKTSKKIKIQSIFSHLAASEDVHEATFSRSQISAFSEIIRRINSNLEEKPMAHLLNTSGVLNFLEAQFDMVRIGIGLYGFANDEKNTHQLKNTHHLKSIISQIHTVYPGESVGYNRGFVAKEELKIATIPIGHADGLSRKLGNEKGSVRIKNKRAKIIGNVCMDMIMVDVSSIECVEGDEVIIFDSQQMIAEISKINATIPYETLTAISQRVRKIVK